MMFVVCGEALYDLFGIENPHGLSFDARIGGSPFNVAVGLARLGHDSALLTGISTDLLGRRLEAALEAEGVSTSLLARKPNPTTLSLVDFGPDNAPTYSFYGHDTADRAMEPDDLPVPGDAIQGVHFGSYSLVAEPVGGTLLGLAQRVARRHLVTLDPNVRLTVEPDLELWRDRVAAFALSADLIKVSAEDLDLIFPGATPETVATDWLDGGAALVVVTAGREGATAYAKAGRLARPGIPVAVADMVGAGDTFQAAIIAALAETGHASREGLERMEPETLTHILDFAAAAAAITCSRRGADMPRRGELPCLTEGSV